MKHGVSVSLFVGDIKPLPQSGCPTGMYKQSVTGAVEIGVDGFVNDKQADRRVHGGPEKAIHLYPASHYAKLAAQFSDAAGLLIPGSLGENISVADFDERDVHIGDVWQLGSSLIQVCQPRNPCWKIDERFDSEGMAIYISANYLTGWYWRVLNPGVVKVGDRLIPNEIATEAFTLFDAMVLWAEHRPDLSALARLTNTPGIAAHWKGKIDQRLSWLQSL